MQSKPVTVACVCGKAKCKRVVTFTDHGLSLMRVTTKNAPSQAIEHIRLPEQVAAAILKTLVEVLHETSK
jgi:hypothetical protein